MVYIYYTMHCMYVHHILYMQLDNKIVKHDVCVTYSNESMTIHNYIHMCVCILGTCHMRLLTIIILYIKLC